MKLLRPILIVFVLLIAESSNGQFAQIWNTRAQKNPALMVLNHSHFANATHRNTIPALSGFRGSNSVSYGMFLKKLHSGIGFYYNNDSWSSSRSNSFKLSYNFQKQLGRQTRLSLGTGLGAIISKSGYIGIPEVIPPSDGTSFGLDFGAALSWKNLIVGTGVQNVLKLNDVARDLNGEKWFNLTAQYTFGKETGFQFFPQALIETDFVFNRSTLNGKIGYKNRYFLAAGIQVNDMAIFSFELFLYQKTRITYSFLYTLNKLSSYFGGGHEIGVCIELKRKPEKRQISGNPSF